MRFHELLLEYNIQKTIDRYGERIISAWFMFTPSAFSPDFNTTAIAIYNAKNAERLLTRGYSVGMGSHMVTVAKPISPSPIQINIYDFIPKISENKNLLITSVIQNIADRDPTSNKQYTQWMLRSWLNSNGLVALGDLNRFNLIGQYHRAKDRGIIQPQDRDINQFKTYEDFENMMTTYDDISTEKIVDRGKYEEIYNGSDARIIIPLDFTASDYYGRGTRWCTAGKLSSAPSKFREYTNQGPLYIIIPKKSDYNGEKYQLHAARAEFMDSNNMSEPLYFLKQRFPSAAKFLLTDVPAFRDTIELTDLYLIQELWQTTILAFRIWIRDNLDDTLKTNQISEYLKKISEYDIHDIMNTVEDYSKVDIKFAKINQLPRIIVYTLAESVNLGELESELETTIAVMDQNNSFWIDTTVKTVGNYIIGFRS